jgi:hypothetical protein
MVGSFDATSGTSQQTLRDAPPRLKAHPCFRGCICLRAASIAGICGYYSSLRGCAYSQYRPFGGHCCTRQRSPMCKPGHGMAVPGPSRRGRSRCREIAAELWAEKDAKGKRRYTQVQIGQMMGVAQNTISVWVAPIIKDDKTSKGSKKPAKNGHKSKSRSNVAQANRGKSVEQQILERTEGGRPQRPQHQSAQPCISSRRGSRWSLRW